MRQFIAETIASFSLDDYRPIVHRDLDLGEPLAPRVGNLVKVVTGMRQSGKSYRLFQEIDLLLTSGIPASRICYFNFEDDRLAPVTPQIGDEVLDAFFAMDPSAMDKGCYLFFDEIQEMSSWGAWLRRVVDTTKATIYVSGSSSKMVQVSVDVLEERTRARELRALWEAMGEAKLKSSTLVVLEGTEETYDCDGMRVHRLPAWQWFLGR